MTFVDRAAMDKYKGNLPPGYSEPDFGTITQTQLGPVTGWIVYKADGHSFITGDSAQGAVDAARKDWEKSSNLNWDEYEKLQRNSNLTQRLIEFIEDIACDACGGAIGEPCTNKSRDEKCPACSAGDFLEEVISKSRTEEDLHTCLPNQPGPEDCEGCWTEERAGDYPETG